jgi:hypothetical protein
MIWLTEGLAPDFKTIADFRKNNREAIKKLFKNFLFFCHKQNLLALETVAVDGTKMRAQNSVNSSYNRKELPHIKRNIENKINEYLKELEAEDENDFVGLKINTDEVQKTLDKLDSLKKLNKKLEEVEEAFEDNPELERYFATDPDCRFQSDKGKKRPGYNVQTAGDEKHKLLIAAEVTNKSNDFQQMSFMVEKIEEVKKELGIEKETNVVMDSGYFSETEIMANTGKENVNIIASDLKQAKENNLNRTGKPRSLKPPTEEYEFARFKYNKEKNIYICPEGKELHRITKNNSKEVKGKSVIQYNCKDCKNCPKKIFCTNNKNGRSIQVSSNKEFMDNFKESMKTAEKLALISKRKEIIEHPFGTLKRTFGYTHFMQTGMQKVQSEFSLMCFVYNLKRVINILGNEKMMAALECPA